MHVLRSNEWRPRMTPQDFGGIPTAEALRCFLHGWARKQRPIRGTLDREEVHMYYCTMLTLGSLTRAFLHDTIDGRQFHHAGHVRVAFDLLARHDFGDALTSFRSGLLGIAERAGRPSAYHETITVAFLSLIAERARGAAYPDYEAFALAHPDVMDKHVLERWYPRERLMSELARRTFVMPEPRR